MNKLWIFGLLMLGFISCKKAPSIDVEGEGEVTDASYTSEAMGWTISIPRGWKEMPLEEANRFTADGKKMMEESTGQEIALDEMSQLLNLRKDKYHVFQSTMERFDESFDGDWNENNELLRETLLDLYRSNGIDAEATEIEPETIGGVEFRSFEIVLRDPAGKVILKQKMHSTLRRGHDFGFSITYQDPKKAEPMFEAIKASVLE